MLYKFEFLSYPLVYGSRNYTRILGWFLSDKVWSFDNTFIVFLPKDGIVRSAALDSVMEVIGEEEISESHEEFIEQYQGIFLFFSSLSSLFSC